MVKPFATAESLKQPKPKAQTPVPGVEVGDHVYIKHPTRGPIAVKVLAHGPEGMTGECDQGKRHQCPWDSMLGTKARMLHDYTVVDRGADGAILSDSKGKRRYLEAPLGGAESPETMPTGPAQEVHPLDVQDDPLMGGIDRLHKSEEFPANARVIFLKGGPIANKAGLALKDVTDKGGHQTKRWVKTMKDQPHPRKPGAADEGGAEKPPMNHGDVVQFRHGDVQGKGKILSSGGDGVTLQDADGREHQVKHEHLTGPADGEAAGKDGNQAAVAPDAKPQADAGATPENPPPLFDAAATEGLPKDTTQSIKDEKELFAKSTEALSQLQEWLDKGKGVASQLGYKTMTQAMDDVDFTAPGGMLFIAPVKGSKRAAEKVESDYGGDWSKLLDTVRCSIAVDSYEEIKSTLAALQKSGMKLARMPKDRFSKPLPVGYRDCLMNVTLPNGLIGEVQLHVKPMLAAKAEGHHHYEVERALNGKATLTEDEQAALRASIAEQSRIYNGAWGASMGGAASGAPMAKALEAAEFSYFDHDNAQFRRRNDGARRAVHDVLINKKWSPYSGEDKLRPAVFGDEIPDPLAGGGDGAGKSTMSKAFERVSLFLKAIIPGKGQSELFAAPVHVDGHMRGGKYVAPFESTRHKKPDQAKPPVQPKPEEPAWRKRPWGEVNGHIGSVNHDGTEYRLHVKYIPGNGYTGGKRFQIDEGPGSKRQNVGHTLSWGGGSTLGDGIDYIKTFFAPGHKLSIYDDTVEKPATEPAPAPASVAAREPPPETREEADARIRRAVKGMYRVKEFTTDSLDSAKKPAPMVLLPKAPDWRDHENWHTRTQAKMKTHTDDQLRYIAKDAAEASRAADSIGGSKAGQYADESHYATMELAARAKVAAEPVHTDKKHYYVSAVDGAKRHLVAGPYKSHADALGRVAHVRRHADSDPRAHFMAWGTAGSDTAHKTPLGPDWSPSA